MQGKSKKEKIENNYTVLELSIFYIQDKYMEMCLLFYL